MKTLKESILADMDDVLDSGDKFIKDSIKQWLKENLDEGFLRCKISETPNKDGKYEVSASGTIKVAFRAKTLTNGMFIWNKVSNDFVCSYCRNLESLEGAPKEVGRDFFCRVCDELTSIKGAPETVGGGFYLSLCKNLKSLKGAPKSVGGSFRFDKCQKITVLEDIPEKIGGDFSCAICPNLISLKGCPKEVKGNFICVDCGKQFAKQEVRKLCKVQGIIYV